MVIEKAPRVFLVALFIRGFWLEVTANDATPTQARYVYKDRFVASVHVGVT